MTIEERAREFVVSRGDGMPDEMELYASIASSFATIEREAAVKDFVKQFESRFMAPPVQRQIFGEIFRGMFNKSL